jgi:RNA polymerase-binding transcription factor DksA
VAPHSPDPIRALLLQERARTVDQATTLAQQLHEIPASSEQVATDDEHDPEGHTLAFERQQIVALLEAARTRASETDAAIARLDSGVYGACEECGRPIAGERLDARPTARRCISCAGARHGVG